MMHTTNVTVKRATSPRWRHQPLAVPDAPEQRDRTSLERCGRLPAAWAEGVDRREQARKSDHRVKDQRPDWLRKAGRGHDAGEQESQRQQTDGAEEQRHRERQQRNIRIHRVITSAHQHHEPKRDRGEQQLDQHVRRQNRRRPQRRGPQPFEDPAFTIDGHDRGQRLHGARRNQKDVKIGRSTETKRGTSGDASRTCGPSSRLITTNSSTGTPTVPRRPSARARRSSRSSQVSVSRVRAALFREASVSNHVPSQFEKDVLERWELRAEVDDPNPMLRQAMDDLGHEIIPAAANRDVHPLAAHRVDVRNRSKALYGGRIFGGHKDRSLGAVPPHELVGRSDVDDATVVDDRHPVAEAFRFSMRWVVERRFSHARMPRTKSHVARRACGSRPVVNSSRNTSSGSLMSASAMNSRCF